MAGYVKALAEIALTKEGTRGTAEGPSAGDWIAHEGADFGPIIEKAENTAGMGSIVGRNDATITSEQSQGAIPMIVQRSHLGNISNLVMGQAPSTTGSDPYTHDWTLANNNSHISYTVSVIDPVAGNKAYPNAMLNTLTLDVVVDDYVKATLDIMGGKEEAGSFSSAYTASDDYFVPDNVEIKFAANYAGLGAASAVCTRSINLNVNKGVVVDPCVGQTTANDFHNQRVLINGDITFKYDTDTYRTLGLSETNNAMQIVMTKGSYSWTIELPSVDFQDWSADTDNDSIMTNTVGFNANYEDKTNGFIKMQVVDAQASH